MNKNTRTDLQIRLTPAEKTGFRRAALHAGLDMSSWARQVLRLEAMKILAAAGETAPFAGQPRKAPRAGDGIGGTDQGPTAYLIGPKIAEKNAARLFAAGYRKIHVHGQDDVDAEDVLKSSGRGGEITSGLLAAGFKDVTLYGHDDEFAVNKTHDLGVPLPRPSGGGGGGGGGVMTYSTDFSEMFCRQCKAHHPVGQHLLQTVSRETEAPATVDPAAPTKAPYADEE